jgi:FixJ family two-component response regulator
MGLCDDGVSKAFDSRELALRLGVSEKTIVKHRAQIPGAFRAGRVWRFDKTTIERYLVAGKIF